MLKLGRFLQIPTKLKTNIETLFFLCYSKFRGSWRPQTRGNGNKFNITNVDIWAGNCDSQQFSSPARRGAGKKKKEIRPQQNILKMISFNLRSASCHLFPRNTKHKHWPLSRWRRANISLDKHLEDKSWHGAPSQKKYINSDAFSAAGKHLSADKLISHEALPQKAAPDKHHQVSLSSAETPFYPLSRFAF